MKKIMIIGCGGAGKSTLAKRLAEQLNIPVYHLDAYFWKKGWIATPRAEWTGVIQNIIARDSWIMDGNFGSTMDMRIKEADTVIFLDFPTLQCLYGVISRRIKYHGKTRPDMAEDCPEKLDWEFISWVASYKKQRAPKIRENLAGFTEKNIFILKNRKEIETFLQNLK
ncbi:adenylate kinase family enzyme [Peribacillus deserti]|uniref:Adenylate kinase family enzyme n=1 Tax=Peribacillus deserti TaxID=673318 RepID=A0ABS2QND2_9BACI|nr:DNA topology modulation protein [Peribacillus deserti]MBM7693998.1 adenylate kinase family enzyme [Peribacillus deserti]